MAFDLFIAGSITFFVLLISGLLFWSHRQSAARANSKQTGAFLTDPTALVQLQLEELLEEKGVPKPAAERGSFEYVWTDKETYEAAKSASASATPAASGDATEAAAAAPAAAPAGGKSLQALLLARSMELARHMSSFDARLAVVRDSYGDQIPRDAVMYLNGISAALRNEAAVVQAEADTVKEGWSKFIMQQAMDLTVGLERRKEARAQAGNMQAQAKLDAENKKMEEIKRKEQEKINKIKEEKEAKERQIKESERAYKELMAGDKKASQKKDAKSSQKK